MEREVVDKLWRALGEPLSENQVVYILSLVRKLLAHRKATAKFFTLQFFSDWAFHVSMDRSGAREFLRRFDDWTPTLVEKKGQSAAEACKYFLLFQFHLEFLWLLREFGLPDVPPGWWLGFVKLYLEVVADCPVIWNHSTLELQHLKELVIQRVNSESGIDYCWKATLKTGDLKYWPLNVNDFFRIRPTHMGEAWAWKGPVLASVGVPEGWVIDNAPDRRYQFSMYPLGYTRESAEKKCAFLYGNIVLKTDAEPTMEAIAKRHERDVLRNIPTAEFERLDNEIKTNDVIPRSLLRVGRIDPSYGGPEYSLYLDNPKGVLLLVFLCPEGKDETYLPALKWIGGTALLMHRIDDSELDQHQILK
jgi:hypothetical protein